MLSDCNYRTFFPNKEETAKKYCYRSGPTAPLLAKTAGFA